MWRSRLGGIVLFLSVLACLGGCGAASDPVVIRVGEREWRRGEFEEAFWKHCASDSGATPDTASLRKYARTFADQRLLEAVAEREVPELEDMRKERTDEFVERLIVDELRKQSYGEAFQIPDKELKAAWEKLGRRLKLRYMLLPTERQASEIRAALREGAAFGKVAQAQSLDEASREQGGDLGWISYLDLDAITRDEIFALRKGEVSRPLQWGRGWQLFQLEDEQPNEARGTIEEERMRLSHGLQISRVRRATKEYQDALLRQYHFQQDPAELAWMTVLLRERTANVDRGEGLANLSEEEAAKLQRGHVPWEGPPVAPADTGRIIARFDPPEGEVKPLLLFDQLFSHPMPTWPRFERGEEVEELIRELVLERLELREARARGIDRRADILRATADRVFEVRSRQYMRTVVRPALRQSEEELAAYYQAHIAEYSQPEARRFVAVNLSDRTRAQGAARLFKDGKTPEEIQSAIAPADTSFKSTGSRGTPALTYGKSPALDDVLFRLPLNAVSDPIPVGATWTVAKVIEIQPYQERGFSEVKGDIQSKVVEQRLPGRLAEILEAAKKTFRYDIVWAELMRSRVRRPA